MIRYWWNEYVEWKYAYSGYNILKQTKRKAHNLKFGTGDSLIAIMTILATNHKRWRHQMKTISVLLALCAGNSPAKFPHIGRWRGALLFSLICARTNGWVNTPDAGDLRRHRAHYDVTVMSFALGNNKYMYLTNISIEKLDFVSKCDQHIT